MLVSCIDMEARCDEDDRPNRKKCHGPTSDASWGSVINIGPCGFFMGGRAPGTTAPGSKLHVF